MLSEQALRSQEWYAQLSSWDQREILWQHWLQRVQMAHSIAITEQMRGLTVAHLSGQLAGMPIRVSLYERRFTDFTVLVAREYAAKYRHGTEGHNALLLIASLARKIEELEPDTEGIEPMTEQGGL